ncbi:hypothetical protein MES5069_50024 [Mesorhizobium escarrei]|uniref:Uncharacterized protein n=1 Tax=Mesorhizobium escarrei TaxID=666018 RepID=A0ABN8K891_9HYPH|nr:hypothetical protein MES5069_50024 [Mesorhizobium escarrei]
MDLPDVTSNTLRVRFENQGWAFRRIMFPPNGDEDHGVGDVDALFIAAPEPSPARHPSEGASSSAKLARSGSSARRPKPRQ